MELHWEGLVGELVYGVADEGNNLFCSLISPHFLRSILVHNDCSKDLNLPPDAFQSIESFCDSFNNSPTSIQDCVTDYAVRGLIHVHGIIEHDGGIGACCASKVIHSIDCTEEEVV